MNRSFFSRTKRSHSQSPFVAASSSHTSFHSSKPVPLDASLQRGPSTVVMVHEDGQCGELSIDGANSYVFDYQPTAVMGGHAPPRFVAGNAFFNYELFGGLRRGGSITLFAREFRGYALAACLSGYAYTIVMYLLIRLPGSELHLDNVARLKNVLSLQWSVVLLVGVVSDAYAPWRLRRKPYMLAGWTLAALLWLVLFLLFVSTAQPPAHATTALLVLAFLAQIVATNAMDVRVIELSQQEELPQRGRLLGTYEAVRIGAQCLAHVLIAAVVTPDTKTLDVHLPFSVAYVFLHLAVACAIPLYWLVYNAQEAPIELSPSQRPPHSFPSPTTTVSAITATTTTEATTTTAKPRLPSSSPQFGAVLRTFWQCAQQRVVWQLLLFNCVLFFFGMFELVDARRAVQFWTRDSASARLVRNAVGDAALVATLLVWRTFGTHLSWRVVTASAIAGWCLTNLALSSLVVYGVVRAPWISALCWTLKAPFRVLMLLAAFVPTIEIAPAGTEGTTYALLASCQTTVRLLAAEIAQAIVHAWPSIQYSTATLRQSLPATENAQFYALLVGTLWISCAALGVFLLPKQRLDAQQLRAYGGYSTLPLVVLIIGFVVAFPYVFYLQVMRL